MDAPEKDEAPAQDSLDTSCSSPAKSNTRVPLFPSRSVRARKYLAEVIVLIIGSCCGLAQTVGQLIIPIHILGVGIIIGLTMPQKLWRLLVAWILGLVISVIIYSAIETYETAHFYLVTSHPYPWGNATLHNLLLVPRWGVIMTIFSTFCFATAAYLGKGIRLFARKFGSH